VMLPGSFIFSPLESKSESYYIRLGEYSVCTNQLSI
jgi:hypothetical protein